MANWQRIIRGTAFVLATITIGTAAAWMAHALSGYGTFSYSIAIVAAAAAIPLPMIAWYRNGQTGMRFVEKTGKDIDRLMIGAAETSFFIESVKKKIEAELQSASEITKRAEEIEGSTEEFASNAGRAAEVAAGVKRESMSGRGQLEQSLIRIGEAQQDAKIASELMTGLQAKSREIQGISEIIDEIATRTNLLALNAAIEAARAGEQGRGFAVVAGEVRQLAQRTKSATEDISKMVRQINEQAERAASGMQSLADKVGMLAKDSASIQSVFNSIESASNTSENEIQQIAHSAHTQVSGVQSIVGDISGIRASMASNVSQLPRVADSALRQSDVAEELYIATADFHVKTHHDKIRVAARNAAAAIEKIFEEAIATGRITQDALFDRTYTPIPNTKPQKHSSRFDAFTDQVLPEIQEKILVEMPHIAYAGAIDNKGYFPTHNKKFTKPLTGNYETDLANNRTKRIFSDRTGMRCATNTKPFLLQTYKRDTGEVMHDLSVPIYVNNQHWGAFRIGYRSVV